MIKFFFFLIFKLFRIIPKKKFLNFFDKFGGWGRPPSILLIVRHWMQVVIEGDAKVYVDSLNVKGVPVD